MPRPSLVDEIDARIEAMLELAQGFPSSRLMRGKKAWWADGAIAQIKGAIRSRLTEIEQELASLRLDALQSESQRLGLYSEYVNAQTGYDREDGG